jgi:hypothetical protein
MNNGNEWYYEPSLAFTRKESIKNLISGWVYNWRQAKEKHGWSCIKVELTLAPINHA